MSGLAPRRQVLIEGADVPQDLSDSIVSVSVEDHAVETDMVTLVVADPDMRWVDSPLLEPGKKVEIKMGYGQALKTVFVGRVARPEATFPQDGAPSLSIRAYDLSQTFRREEERKARTWQNTTDSQLARDIASRHAFSPVDLDIETTTVVIPYVAQGNISDWEFLQKRAERIGFELFVELGKFHFHKPKDAGRVTVGALEYGRNLRSFEPRISLDQQVTKVVVRGWDADKKAPIIAMATSETMASRAKQGTITGADHVKTDFGAGVKVLQDLCQRSQKEAEDMSAA